MAAVRDGDHKIKLKNRAEYRESIKLMSNMRGACLRLTRPVASYSDLGLREQRHRWNRLSFSVTHSN